MLMTGAALGICNLSSNCLWTPRDLTLTLDLYDILYTTLLAILSICYLVERSSTR